MAFPILDHTPDAQYLYALLSHHERELREIRAEVISPKERENRFKYEFMREQIRRENIRIPGLHASVRPVPLTPETAVEPPPPGEEDGKRDETIHIVGGI